MLQVSKERRKFLHNQIDVLNAMGRGYRLLHNSRGDGRQRTLIVKKVAQNETGDAATTMSPGLDLSRILSQSNELHDEHSMDFASPGRTSSVAAPTGPGHRWELPKMTFPNSL